MGTDADRWDVAVVGSANIDHVVRADRVPGPGETLLGGAYRTGIGGKGVNQALAAAAFGASTALFCRVGQDSAGARVLNELRSRGVACPLAAGRAATGVALITVTSTGENAIVVAPGANSELTPEDTATARGSRVILAQLEVPIETVRAAASIGGVCVLNPAPARPLPEELLTEVDYLVPNRSEIASLLGSPEPRSVPDAAQMGLLLARRGPTVVVTLGADGAVLCEGESAWHLRAPQVAVVDTTGAGDSFCGVFAGALAQGMPTLDAAGRAVAAGSLAVRREGAAATPDRDGIDALAATLTAPTRLSV